MHFQDFLREEKGEQREKSSKTLWLFFDSSRTIIVQRWISHDLQREYRGNDQQVRLQQQFFLY